MNADRRSLRRITRRELEALAAYCQEESVALADIGCGGDLRLLDSYGPDGLRDGADAFRLTSVHVCVGDILGTRQRLREVDEDDLRYFARALLAGRVDRGSGTYRDYQRGRRKVWIG